MSFASIFPRVGIVGIGLIGGSLACAIKHFSPDTIVVGIDKDSESLRLAESRKVLDSSSTQLETLRDADLVVLATPIHEIFQVLPLISKIIKPNAVVTDTGSTKVRICQEAEKYLPKAFVGGHPLTGSERAGMSGALPFLFENAIFVLTPLALTSSQNVERLSKWFQLLGADTLVLEPQLHDRVAAFVSHLPQLVSVALCKTVAEQNEGTSYFAQLAAGGFRDMTRIASSPFRIWKDILESNSSQIAEALDQFLNTLASMRSHLQNHDVEDAFSVAREFRNELPVRSKGFLKKFHRLAILLPDTIGALSQVTTELAKQQISVKDLELLRLREHDAGTFHFYFENESAMHQAATALRTLGFECHEVGEL